MATMLPSEVEAFHTDGEGRFYQFLQQVAQPDRAFIAWYTPDIEDREPDFLLYHDELGLIVFEVKDWGVSQIRHADAYHWQVVFEGRPEKRLSPLRQARDYHLRPHHPERRHLHHPHRKGLDFSCVFLVGIDGLESGHWTPEQLLNLTYVGLTRARHRLVVPYWQENFLLKKLLACR